VNQQGWHSFGEKELGLVNKWAFEGEKIIRGIANVTAQSVDMGTLHISIFFYCLKLQN
jgi:hypothetical protein